MANVTFSKQRVLELIGKKLDDKTLVERSNMMGVEVEELKGDSLSLEITANRPDRLSEEGYARALKKFLGIVPGLSAYDVKRSEYVAHIDHLTKNVREFAVCAVVKNVPMNRKLFEDIIQLQEKLHLTLARRRKSAAIGVHDLSKIAFPITYTTVKEKFSFVPLESKERMTVAEILEKHQKGKEYKHLVPGPLYPIWVDAKQEVVAFPPIINGSKTAIDENTKELFIDVTGTHKKTVEEMLNVIVTTLAEAGAEIYEVRVNGISYPDLEAASMEVESTYINKLLGLNLTQNEIETCLEKMGYGVKVLDRSKMAVFVPPYRVDVLHPIDLAEDVAIGYGYENLKAEIPNVATIAEENVWTIRGRKLIEILTGLGFQETNTNHLMSEKELESARLPKEHSLKTINAVNIEYNILRPAILPIHLKIIQENKHHDYPQKICEVGAVILHDKKEDTNAKETYSLSCCIVDQKVDYTEVRAVLDALLHGLGIPYVLKEATHPLFLEGRTAEIVVNKHVVGHVGEIHPQVLNSFEIEMPVVAIEIHIEKIF